MRILEQKHEARNDQVACGFQLRLRVALGPPRSPRHAVGA
jgi:hypothetical protein